MSDLQAPFPWFGGKRRVAPVIWRTAGGYGGGRGGRGDENRHKERIYFSPGCIAEDMGLLDLLGDAS